MEKTQSHSPVILFGEWFTTMLVAAIPIVGQVMLCIWAFGTKTNPTKASWAKATLVWLLVIIALYFLVFAALVAAFMGGAKHA